MSPAAEALFCAIHRFWTILGGLCGSPVIRERPRGRFVACKNGGRCAVGGNYESKNLENRARLNKEVGELNGSKSKLNFKRQNKPNDRRSFLAVALSSLAAGFLVQLSVINEEFR